VISEIPFVAKPHAIDVYVENFPIAEIFYCRGVRWFFFFKEKYIFKYFRLENVAQCSGGPESGKKGTIA
jgi:hypothetical protein